MLLTHVTSISIGFLLSLTVLTGQVAWAGTLYKWVDENGNVTYQDTPPPSSVNYEEQTVEDTESEDETASQDSQQSLNEAVENNPVSFYSIPECDACDLVRLYLENASIPFAEKDIQTNITVQQELLSRTGQLRVPTVIVGQDAVDGYSKSGLRRILIDNNYPVDELAAANQEQSGDETDETEQNQVEQAESEEEEIYEGLTNADLDKLTSVSDEEDLVDQQTDEVIELETDSVSEIEYE